MTEFAFIKNNSKHGKDGYHRWQCHDCERERVRRQYHANILYHKDRNTKYRHEVMHGLGPGGYDTMLASQGGVCAICKSDNPGGARKYFAVDHDHNHCPGKYGCKNCVRGLLCGQCNMALGGFQDNIQRLESAIEYIRLVSE